MSKRARRWTEIMLQNYFLFFIFWIITPTYQAEINNTNTFYDTVNIVELLPKHYNVSEHEYVNRNQLFTRRFIVNFPENGAEDEISPLITSGRQKRGHADHGKNFDESLMLFWVQDFMNSEARSKEEEKDLQEHATMPANFDQNESENSGNGIEEENLTVTDFQSLSPSEVKSLAEKLYTFVRDKYLSSNDNMRELIEKIWFDPSFARNHLWDKNSAAERSGKSNEFSQNQAIPDIYYQDNVFQYADPSSYNQRNSFSDHPVRTSFAVYNSPPDNNLSPQKSKPAAPLKLHFNLVNSKIRQDFPLPNTVVGHNYFDPLRPANQVIDTNLIRLKTVGRPIPKKHHKTNFKVIPNQIPKTPPHALNYQFLSYGDSSHGKNLRNQHQPGSYQGFSGLNNDNGFINGLPVSSSDIKSTDSHGFNVKPGNGLEIDLNTEPFKYHQNFHTPKPMQLDAQKQPFPTNQFTSNVFSGISHGTFNSLPGISNAFHGIMSGSPGTQNASPGIRNSSPGINFAPPGSVIMSQHTPIASLGNFKAINEINSASRGKNQASPGNINASPGSIHASPGVTNSQHDASNPSLSSSTSIAQDHALISESLDELDQNISNFIRKVGHKKIFTEFLLNNWIKRRILRNLRSGNNHKMRFSNRIIQMKPKSNPDISSSGLQRLDEGNMDSSESHSMYLLAALAGTLFSLSMAHIFYPNNNLHRSSFGNIREFLDSSLDMLTTNDFLGRFKNDELFDIENFDTEKVVEIQKNVMEFITRLKSKHSNKTFLGYENVFNAENLNERNQRFKRANILTLNEAVAAMSSQLFGEDAELSHLNPSRLGTSDVEENSPNNRVLLPLNIFHNRRQRDKNRQSLYDRNTNLKNFIESYFQSQREIPEKFPSYHTPHLKYLGQASEAASSKYVTGHDYLRSNGKIVNNREILDLNHVSSHFGGSPTIITEMPDVRFLHAPRDQPPVTTAATVFTRPLIRDVIGTNEGNLLERMMEKYLLHEKSKEDGTYKPSHTTKITIKPFVKNDEYKQGFKHHSTNENVSAKLLNKVINAIKQQKMVRHFYNRMRDSKRIKDEFKLAADVIGDQTERPGQVDPLIFPNPAVNIDRVEKSYLVKDWPMEVDTEKAGKEGPMIKPSNSVRRTGIVRKLTDNEKEKIDFLKNIMEIIRTEEFKTNRSKISDETETNMAMEDGIKINEREEYSPEIMSDNGERMPTLKSHQMYMKMGGFKNNLLSSTDENDISKLKVSSYIDDNWPKPDDKGAFGFLSSEMTGDSYDKFIESLSVSLKNTDNWSSVHRLPPVDVSIPSASEENSDIFKLKTWQSPSNSVKRTEEIGLNSYKQDFKIIQEEPFTAGDFVTQQPIISSYQMDYQYSEAPNITPVGEELTTFQYPPFDENNFLKRTHHNSYALSHDPQRVQPDLELADDLETENWNQNEHSSSNKKPSNHDTADKLHRLQSWLSYLNPNNPDILENLDVVLDLIIGNSVNRQRGQLEHGSDFGFQSEHEYSFPKSRDVYPIRGRDDTLDTGRSRKESVISILSKLAAINSEAKEGIIEESDRKKPVERIFVRGSRSQRTRRNFIYFPHCNNFVLENDHSSYKNSNCQNESCI